MTYLWANKPSFHFGENKDHFQLGLIATFELVYKRRSEEGIFQEVKQIFVFQLLHFCLLQSINFTWLPTGHTVTPFNGPNELCRMTYLSQRFCLGRKVVGQRLGEVVSFFTWLSLIWASQLVWQMGRNMIHPRKIVFNQSHLPSFQTYLCQTQRLYSGTLVVFLLGVRIPWRQLI